MNCATWNSPECNGMSRPTMLNAIKVNAEAAHSLAVPTITDDEYDKVIYHYNKYMADKNCLGNVLNGGADCAPPGVSNCSCLQMAMQYSTGVGNWPACIVKLVQGH